jgi:hypothetical protein
MQRLSVRPVAGFAALAHCLARAASGLRWARTGAAGTAVTTDLAQVALDVLDRVV